MTNRTTTYIGTHPPGSEFSHSRGCNFFFFVPLTKKLNKNIDLLAQIWVHKLKAAQTETDQAHVTFPNGQKQGLGGVYETRKIKFLSNKHVREGEQKKKQQHKKTQQQEKK